MVKIRCMIISEEEWKYLPYSVSKYFKVGKRGNFICYIACLSPYLISKISKMLKSISINGHRRKQVEDTFKVFCLNCDKSTPHIELPYVPFMDKKIKCTVCGDEQFDKFAIYTSRFRN